MISRDEMILAVARQMGGWNDDTSEPNITDAETRSYYEARWERINRTRINRACLKEAAKYVDAILALSFPASETEWAARVTPLDTDYGDPRYYQYPDRLSVERFIKNPPLWYDKRPGETMAVVARRKAGPWMELEE